MARYFTLANATRSLKIPSLGIGTYLLRGNKGKAAMDLALFNGYRHIDTARRYWNEQEVGEVVNSRIGSGYLKRNDVFITTKVPSAHLAPKDVKLSLEASLENLKLPSVDMFLIHYPWGNKNKDDTDDEEFNERMRREHVNFDLNETWAAMEELVDSGKTSAIGVSNFSVRLLDMIWEKARIKPSNLQCECHIYWQQSELLNYCKRRNIVMTAYAPLGAPGFPNRPPGEPYPLEDKVVRKVAEKHKRTVGQVMLRHLLQKQIVVIPKSNTEQRLKENAGIYDFQLDDVDMDELNRLDKKVKLFIFDWAKKHPLYKEGEEF